MAGLLDALLTHVGRYAQVPLNVARGRFGAAGRQLADIAGELIDAPLPGDWIPEISRPEDEIRGSQVFGMDKDDNSFLRKLTDLVTETAANPLTYLGVRGASGAKALAKEAKTLRTLAKQVGREEIARMSPETAVELAQRHASALGRKDPASIEAFVRQAYHETGGDPEALAQAFKASPLIEQGGITFAGREIVGPEAIESVGQKVAGVTNKIPQLARVKAGQAAVKLKAATGHLSAGSQYDAALKQAMALGNQATVAGKKQVDDIFRGFSKSEDQALADIYDGVIRDKSGKVVDHLPTTTIARTDLTTGKIDPVEIDVPLQERAAAYFAKVPVDPQSKAKLMAAMDKIEGYNVRMTDDLKATGAMPIEKAHPGGYLSRQWRGARIDPDTEDLELIEGPAQPMMGRSLLSGKDVKAFVEDPANAGMSLVGSARERMLSRIQKQGRILTRGQIAKTLLGDLPKGTADRETMQTIATTMDRMKNAADPAIRELGESMGSIAMGMPPRNAITTVLAKMNRYFKPAATTGFIIPRASFSVRNRMVAPVQAAATSGADPWQSLKSAIPDIKNAWRDATRSALGLPKHRVDELGKMMDTIDAAYDSSGGSVVAFRDTLTKTPGMGLLSEAVNNGVLNGFVSTEGMLSSLAGRLKNGEKWQRILDFAPEINAGVESRMRLGTFIDLRKRGYSERAASKITRETFLDYDMMTPQNRTLRDLIPFAQFMAQTIPQQAKAMARRPAFATVLASLYGGNADEPLEPRIEGTTKIPLGGSKYLLGFGMPYEALENVPNLSDDRFSIGETVRRGVIGSSHPLAKATVGYVTGRDPYFGTDYGTYEKTPRALQALGAPEGGAFGRIFNEAAGAGLLQPIVSPLNMVEQATNPESGVAEKAGRLIFGAKVATNDPDRALIAKLEQRLAKNPAVKERTVFFGGSDEEKQINRELAAARRRLKLKADKKKEAEI